MSAQFAVRHLYPKQAIECFVILNGEKLIVPRLRRVEDEESREVDQRVQKNMIIY